MQKTSIILAVMLFTGTPLCAQLVNDGATNTLSNVTNSLSSVFVGTNAPFTLLVLSNDCLVTNITSYIGFNANARSNEARLVSASTRWRMSDGLIVGYNGGFNRLTVNNGATVVSSFGILGVNSTAATNNVVVVSGIGSVWSNAGDLNLGNLAGGNRLEISEGGWVGNHDGTMPFAISNRILVTGAGSVWSNRNDLILGLVRGGNQLVISNGGTVFNRIGYLGQFARSSNNLAVVTGTGSVWANSSDLNVGAGDQGNQLVVSNGATVLVGGTLFLGTNALPQNNRVTVDGGTLHVTNAGGTALLFVRRGTNALQGGFVETDALQVTGSSSRFTFNGGTLSTRSSLINNALLFRVGDGVSPATLNLAGNGSHTFTDGLLISANAMLTGNGIISGIGGAFVTVANGGTLSPGDSIGLISFNISPALSGTTWMEISKLGAFRTNDQVMVGAPLTFGGVLVVTNISGTELILGDRFRLFGALTYLGNFGNVALPPLAFGLVWTNKLLVDGSIEVITATPPTVQTLPASAIGTDTATLNGVANPHASATTVWFEFGVSTNYGNTTAPQPLGSGASNTNFSQGLTNLFGDVTYNFRAVASNNIGVTLGDNQSFGPLPAFADTGAGLPGVDGSQVDFFHSSGFAAWGDYDNDGLLDILLAGRGILQVWRNTGVGFINSGATQSLPLWGCSAAWGDLDNDGRLDFVVTGREENASGPYAVVRHNTGSGFIDVNTNFNARLPGVHAGAAVLGDHDNDGLLDILMTGAGASTEVWRNIGNGWRSINAGLTPADNSSAAWGDYDNDGRLDVMLNSSFGGLWRNTGSGFTNTGMLGGVANGSVAWGDYDNDGRLDLLLTGGSSHTDGIALVLRNTGNGFTNIQAGLPAVYRSTAAWGDYDNDGRLDILLTGTTNINATGGIAQVWRNTGNGFTNINLDLPGVSRGATIWGDYDNDGRLDLLIAGVDRNIERITQVWRNQTPVSNTPPTAPTGLATTVAGGEIILSWNAASDAQTPASGLTYNLRIGTTPGGSDVLAPMASATGLRRLPQMGNANGRLFAKFATEPVTHYYWSVQAVDGAFAGGPFAPERSFSMTNVVLLTSIDGTPIGPIAVPGDQNSDGIVSQAELAAVLTNLNGDGIVTESNLALILSHYFPNSPFLQMTNVAGLGGTNVTFALTNNLAGAFSVEYTTNLVDWLFLGPATPRYLFTDTNAPPAEPQRYYRLRWP